MAPAASALALLVLSVLVPGCSAAPSSPLAGPQPSDPAVAVPATRYRSTLGSYARQRPVEPSPWREQNERVAPKE